MRKTGWVALALGLALTAGTVEANTVVEKNITIESKAKSSEQMMNRLREIKAEAVRGHLSQNRKQDLKKEVLSIKKQMKEKDPVLVISLTAALIIALILILLAR